MRGTALVSLATAAVRCASRRAWRMARHSSRRQVVTVGPLGLAMAGAPRARAAQEPPTVMKKVTDGVHIFDQAYGIPGLEVGEMLSNFKIAGGYPENCCLMDLGTSCFCCNPRCQHSHSHDRAEFGGWWLLGLQSVPSHCSDLVGLALVVS